MRRRVGRTLIVYACMAVLVAIPIIQLYDWYGEKREKGDAVELLYQVSGFQMELLAGYMNEAGRAKDTEQLNGLRQAAYSANFTHERLSMALGRDELEKLESVNELLQWMVRLQIGGQRALKPEETQTLQEAAKLFKPFYDEYGKLMTNGRYVSSQGDKIMKIDHELAELIRKRQLR